MSSSIRNHVQIIGSGEQTIIFSHGYGCDQTMWKKLIPYFAKNYRCILFDHVGFGQSDLSQFSPAKYDSLHAYARDINEILFEKNTYKSIFVGHSVSSMIGMLAAIERPENFSSLIMVSPSPCYLNLKDYKGGFDLSDIMALLENLDSNFADWSQAMSKLIMGNAERPSLAESLNSSFCKVGPLVMKHFAEITFLSDFREELSQSLIPSLILQCSDDHIASAHVGEYLHKHLKRSEILHMKARGHCPHMSEPIETAVAILDYLESVRNFKLAV
jgi:sigma-B regulation protein RsbQ